MHICFIASEFPLPGVSFGGIGTFLISYSKILIAHGHQVSIVGISKGSEIKTEVNGVKIYYASAPTAKYFKWYTNSQNITRAIRNIHHENPIDIVEAQEAGFAFVSIPKGIAKVIRMHGGHYFFSTFEDKKINKWKAFRETLSFGKCDGVIATSEFVDTQTSKFINYKSKVKETINNPILMDMFYPADKSKAIKGAAVFAGTICEKKGIRQLCLAIPEIIKKVPDFHLYAYGREWFFPDGSMYKDWLLPQLGPEIIDRITFRSPVTYAELPGVYELGEICIFPSHMEVQGLVAPEAMSMKKPVVFTQYGPGPETIDDGVNGWLCDPRKPESIAETVIKVFEQRSRFDEIGEHARKKVAQKFSPESIYQKNINFYTKIKLTKNARSK